MEREEEREMLLQSIRKHVVLTEEEADRIAAAPILRKVRKGQFLIHEGAFPRATFYICKGSVRTYFTDLGGQEHIVQFAIEGWWTGDLLSHVANEPAKLNVEAMEACTILELQFDRLQQLYDTIPAMEKYFRISFMNASAAMQQRMLDNLCLSAEERYLAFTRKYAIIERRIPQKYVASYLGISPEFLSKIKKRLIFSAER